MSPLVRAALPGPGIVHRMGRQAPWAQTPGVFVVAPSAASTVATTGTCSHTCRGTLGS